MSQAKARARYIRLGAFILGAVIIAVIFLIAFGAGYWWRPRVLMETYFDESVQGIDIGSPLKYRGVSIGEVSRIGFTYTEYEQDKPPTQRKQYVLVEASLRTRELTGELGSIAPGMIGTLIERGLRVQMAAQGLTGTYYLEVDYVDPQRNPPLPIEWQPDNLYIPSTRSTVGQIVSGAESLVRKLERANLDEVMLNLSALMVTLNATLKALQTDRLGDSTVHLLSELRDTNRALQGILSNPVWRELPAETSATLASARRALENEQLPRALDRLDQTLQTFDRAAARLDRTLVGPERDLPLILDNLRQTTDNLRDFSESLRRSPRSVLFADPPAPLPRPAPTGR